MNRKEKVSREIISEYLLHAQLLLTYPKNEIGALKTLSKDEIESVFSNIDTAFALIGGARAYIELKGNKK